MTNREMFLLATSILFASTTAGLVLQGTLAKPPHGPDFRHERPFGGPDGHGPRPDFFAKADANNDGFVTREEMAARQQAKLDQIFETVDTNKDGKLSREEMEKGRDLMRAKMKARFEAERKGLPAPTEAPAQ